jgi:hypothetical protein
MPVIRKILVTAAALAATTVISASPSSAQSVAPSTATDHQDSVGCFHAFTETDFTGPDKWFCGSTGVCNYVGDGWNDLIQSARTESNSVKVELWDNSDCTGGAIVIDRTGYHEIGTWVSAYRVTT